MPPHLQLLYGHAVLAFEALLAQECGDLEVHVTLEGADLAMGGEGGERHSEACRAILPPLPSLRRTRRSSSRPSAAMDARRTRCSSMRDVTEGLAAINELCCGRTGRQGQAG